MITSGFQYPPFVNAERVIEEFRNKASKTDNEILAAYNDQGILVCENVGNDNTVMVPAEAEGHWLMHSHPNSSAPLSIQDLLVISDMHTKMNLAVASDGGLCWSTGFRDKSHHMVEKVDAFMHSPLIQSMLFLTDLVASEDVAGTASNWDMLSFFTMSHAELQDLYVLAGSDSRGYRLSLQLGVMLPREFSWKNDLTTAVSAI